MNVWKLLGDTSNPRSAASMARRKRAQMLLTQFPDLAEMRVLDLGGTGEFWRTFPVKPRELILVNLEPDPLRLPTATCLVGDVCELSEDLRTGFDLIVSNSVIEHVGGHWRRSKFAEAVRTAPHYWVQTPNRWFPMEPHFMLPGQHWLPTGLKAHAATIVPVSHKRRRDRYIATEDALEIELLTKPEMRHYFPDAHILHERVGGLSKSIIAYR